MRPGVKRLQRWIVPASANPDEAFRERTLRAAVLIFILAQLVNIVVTFLAPSIPDARALLWAVFMLFTGLAGLFLHLQRVEAAALTVAFMLLATSATVQVRQGYWSGLVFMIASIAITFGTLVFTRRKLTMLGSILMIQYVGIATWQDRADIPVAAPSYTGNWVDTPMLASVAMMVFILLLLGLNFYFADEFARRANRVRELVNSLELRVTERTAELHAANRQLLELDAAKDVFVSNVSHELRTPITNMKLRYTLLHHQPEKLAAHLEVIQRETDRLAHTIDDLLILSRLDQERTRIHWSDLDLSALAQQYIHDRIPVAQHKQITLTACTQADVPLVRGDAGLIEQGLSILVTNALNYTPAGGQVTVTTELRRVDGTTWIELAVEDNGPGIPPEEQKRLFERFFRGSAAHAAGTPGTGLGLAILHEIIERHHGHIAVHSTGIPGEGARFCVRLPPA